MKKSEATQALTSDNAHLRLRAARFFAKNSTAGDRQVLQAALAAENVVWIRSALSHAIENAVGAAVEDMTTEAVHAGTDDGSQIDDVYASAIEETTRRLVHEIEPILGTARLCAQREIADFSDSRTKRQLDKLELVLRGIDRLSRAASAPTFEEFDLAGLIRETVDGDVRASSVRIEYAGPSPCLVIADKSLVQLALTNGVKNATESTLSLSPAIKDLDSPSVIIAWGVTDVDYWIAVLDSGVGLPIGAGHVWDIGVTSKAGHIGMGLAIAQRAVLSLGGVPTLRPRSEAGAAYEFRWPRRNL